MKPHLLHVVLEATKRCNLACKYCYNPWHACGDESEGGNGSYRLNLRALKELFSVCDTEHITLTGGEPFLSERFTELVLCCRMKGKSVNILSNGTVTSAETYRELIQLGVGFFQFPILSASSELHDHLTGTAGSWTKSVGSVKAVLANSGRLAVAFVLTAVNAPSLEPTFRFAFSLGVRSFLLARFNLGGRGIANRGELMLTHEQLKQAFAAADCFARDTGASVSANVCVPLCVIDPTLYPRLWIGTCGQDAARRPLTLDSAGNLRMCNHSPVVMGNIFEDGIEGILRTPYVQQWKSVRPVYCASCEKWERCGGGCRAASEQLGLGLEREDPLISM